MTVAETRSGLEVIKVFKSKLKTLTGELSNYPSDCRGSVAKVSMQPGIISTGGQA